MNRKDLYQSFNGIDDEILERSEQTVSGVMPVHHRLTVLLVAMLCTLFLMGAGVVAVIYGKNIQNWFGYYFDLVTGQEMSEGQKAIIDHLSQEIRLSQTVDGTTVTVDSVTVGDDGFYLLLRVEGDTLSKRYSYHFREIRLEVLPDVLENAGGMGSYGISFHGIDGDGAALILVDYKYASREGFVLDITPLDVHLVLENLSYEPRSDEQNVVTEGIWDFEFTIDRSQPPMSVSLPDTEVMLWNRDLRKHTPVLLTNIELTNTGIRFQYDYSGEKAVLIGYELEVILKSGAQIGISGGANTIMKDEIILNCSYHWRVPIDLNDVKAVRFGDVEIPME